MLMSSYLYKNISNLYLFLFVTDTIIAKLETRFAHSVIKRSFHESKPYI